jgi:hypothetical protein
MANTQPKFSDVALSDLSRMFFSDPGDPTPGGPVRNAVSDYSIESLSAIDDHLERVRQNAPEGDALLKFVLRGGAFVGEVIRKQSKTKTWHWLAFADAAKIDPQVAAWGQSLSTIAVLWDGKGFCFPLGKVLKFLQNGREDSVKFFAQVIIAGPPGRGG